MKSLIVGFNLPKQRIYFHLWLSEICQTKKFNLFCLGTRIPTAAIDVIDLIEKSQEESKRQQL